MMFHVGQKVVCVAGPVPDLNWPGENQPVIGQIYTIRAVRTKVKRPQYGVSLLLEEITNPSGYNGQEAGFYSSRFRPVVQRQTDISFAHEILRKAKAPARALAFSATEHS